MISKLQNYIPTILIVDDNSNNIKIIALTLRPLNYKLVIATSGETAIDMVKKTKPDLVLLDVMMPILDGYETCRIIKSKSENANLPVIFLSALSDKENTIKGFEAGGVDYVTKPFNQGELISRVNTHLELKLIRDEMERTSQHLFKLNEVKNKMFSVIGHDLRSPLGSVKMTLEYLSSSLDEIPKEELSSVFNSLTKTTDEVFGLLENLLGWAKSQSGNLTVEKEILDLHALAQNVYLLNKGSFNLKNINFNLNVNPGSTIYADLNTITAVFRNLISNAIKFTPAGGIISISSKDVNGDVIIEFKDNGVGIPENVIHKLFDSTQYVTTYGTNNEAGSGLGLNLCFDFTHKNGGEIWVESKVGEGSSFFIRLPRKLQ